MQCANHPTREATIRCDGCAEPYCSYCIVEVSGQSYCAACKVIALKGRTRVPRPIRRGTIPPKAYVALSMALVGLLCCCLGLPLHPAAIFVAHLAVQEIRASNNLIGIEVARAAQAIAAIGIFAMIIQIIEVFANMANQPEAM